MNLPLLADCEKDPVLNMLRLNDFNGYLNPNKGTNKSFLNRRRVNYAYELLSKHLSKDRSVPVADFACGSANFGIQLAEAGYKVDLYDNEAKHFDYIKLKTNASENLNFQMQDISQFVSEKKYFAAFYGEVIEHMADPVEALKLWRENLLTGGLLCLTTPNGDYIDCNEPKWEEVKDQKDRNQKLANNIGNHVCEFGFEELKSLVKQAGFGILEHKLVNSKQVSQKSLLRRILPQSLLWRLDDKWSSSQNENGQHYGRIQIIVAQRFH